MLLREREREKKEKTNKQKIYEEKYQVGKNYY